MHLILFFIVVVVGVGLVLARRSARRERLTRDLGTELGGLADRLGLEVLVLQQEEQRTAIDQLLAGSRLHPPASGGEARFDRVICGPLDGYQVTLLDYSDSRTGKIAFTVLVLRCPAAGLPRFQLEPTSPSREPLPPKVEALRPLQPRDSILFNDSFKLEVRDEDLERLETLLRGPAMEFFEARLDARLLVESLGDRLLIYEAARVLSAPQAEKLLRRSTELADALTGRVRPPPPPPPEPETPPAGPGGGG